MEKVLTSKRTHLKCNGFPIGNMTPDAHTVILYLRTVTKSHL